MNGTALPAQKRASSTETTVREVGLRDGLQSAPPIPTSTKVQLAQMIAGAGVGRIEVGSFVSRRAVPQMADTADVLAALGRGDHLEVLVVNPRSATEAIRAGAKVLVALSAVSETFSQRNVRTSVSAGLRGLAEIAAIADEAGASCVATVSTAFGCAYEGPVADRAVHRVAEAIAGAGVGEIMLCDTIGMATPTHVTRLVGSMVEALGDEVTIGLHFHNTRGLGLANVMAGLAAGIRLFDASVGGLGGCPFAPGATGNICTEDLVHLLEAEGLRTGIDIDALVSVSRRLETALDVTLPGQVMRSGPIWRVGRRAAEA